MSNFSEVDTLLERLTRETYHGRTYFLIWRDLGRAIQQNPTAHKATPTFWGFTIHAHLGAALHCILLLVDKHPKAQSVFALLKEAERNRGVFRHASPQKVSQIVHASRKKLDQYEQTMKRLKTLRDNTFAHISKEAVLDPKKFALLDQRTIKETEQLYDAIGEIINDISGALKSVETAMEVLDWDEFHYLLKLVERGAKARMDDLTRQ